MQGLLKGGGISIINIPVFDKAPVFDFTLAVLDDIPAVEADGAVDDIGLGAVRRVIGHALLDAFSILKNIKVLDHVVQDAVGLGLDVGAHAARDVDRHGARPIHKRPFEKLPARPIIINAP